MKLTVDKNQAAVLGIEMKASDIQRKQDNLNNISGP